MEKPKKKDSLFSNLEVNKISDNSIICGNVLFWNNGKSLIVIAEHICQLFSVTTGDYIKDLFSCKSKIISCNFHPKDQNLLIALCENGEFVKYDLISNSVKKTVKFVFKAEVLNSQKVSKFNVKKKFYVKSDFEENFHWDNELLNDEKNRKFYYGLPLFVDSFSEVLIWASWSLKDELQSHVSLFFSNTGTHVKRAKLPSLAFKQCYKNFSVCQTNDRNILFIGMGSNFVLVCHYKERGLFIYSSRVHILGDEVEVTCLTLHPKEYSFATGDSRGTIIVWKNILDKHPLKSFQSWHTVNINDIAFSDEGVHLFSGGDEHVLVKWSSMSNQKNFLPRLSSPICHITVGQEIGLIAVSLADNEIYIIDSNFQSISVIKRYSIYCSDAKRNNILAFDPRSDHLVLNGRPGYLQFLSLKKSLKFLYSLDVGKTNYMTGDKNLVNLELTHAKFSRNGSWLVTAEAKKDKFFKEYRLKFWYFDEVKQSFILNTSMELPHDENDINALEISSDDLVATSGSDKQFKLWAPFETSDLSGTKTVWSLLSVGRYKLLPCNPIDFSKDATLIAVGFGPSLTLWNTSTCSLKCSLIPPFKRDVLKFVKFGNDEHSHLIVTATDYALTAWNIITLTIMWNVILEVEYLVGNFFNTYMCVFSKSNTLFVFSPSTTSPEITLENISKAQVIAAQSVFFASNDTSPFQLYFLNSEQELFCLKSREEPEEQDMAYDEDNFITPFSAQLAQKSGGNVMKSVAEYVPSKSKKNSQILSILDAPAHTLPNPSRFCADFLESLIISVDKPKGEPDAKSKTTVEDDEIIEINNDLYKNTIDVVTEESLWVSVNNLFK